MDAQKTLTFLVFLMLTTGVASLEGCANCSGSDAAPTSAPAAAADGLGVDGGALLRLPKRSRLVLDPGLADASAE